MIILTYPSFFHGANPPALRIADKELRGFLLKGDGNSVSLYCLSEGDLFSAQNTDF